MRESGGQTAALHDTAKTSRIYILGYCCGRISFLDLGTLPIEGELGFG